MTEFNGFHGLAEELSDLAEEFRSEKPVGNVTGSGKFGSTKGAISEGISEAMDEIVRIARMRATVYVPEEDAQTIMHEQQTWTNGDKYFHKFYAESDLVAFHEFGTGTKAEHPTYPGTVNAVNSEGRAGYLIDPPGDKPVAYEVGGESFVFQYVVHPGVPANHFMRKSLERNSGKIEDSISEKLDDYFSNIV